MQNTSAHRWDTFLHIIKLPVQLITDNQALKCRYLDRPGTTYAPNRTQHDPINPPKPNKNPSKSHILAPREKKITLYIDIQVEAVNTYR